MLFVKSVAQLFFCFYKMFVKMGVHQGCVLAF